VEYRHRHEAVADHSDARGSAVVLHHCL
jgi:hypothetical protein